MASRKPPALRPLSREAELIGRRFRELREAAGVGLRPLAAEMGITVFCIRRHEAGAMMLRADDLFRAIKILGWRPADFFDLNDGDSDGQR